MSAQVPQGYPPAAHPQGAPGWGTQQAQWGAPATQQQYGYPQQPTYPQQPGLAQQPAVGGYYQGGYAAPPAPKSNSALKIILGIVLVPLVVLGVLIIIGLVAGDDDPPAPPPTTRTTTTSTTTSTTTQPPTTTTTTTTQPTQTTQTTETTQPTQPTQTTQGGGGWVNDGYTVPDPDPNPSNDDVPRPVTYGDALEMLENNPLYTLEVPVPVQCDLARVDGSALNDAQMEAHLNDVTACLQRVWDPTLAEVGLRLPRPTVTVYGQPIDTPCGDKPAGTQNAFYCSANQQVYFANDLIPSFPYSIQDVPFMAPAVIAHEMAHAVQYRVGILVSSNAWEQAYERDGYELQALEQSRRLELQADCLAGAFFQSIELSIGITEADADNLTTLFYNLGDDVLTGDPNYVGNHGHGQSRINWFWQGATQKSLLQCATFLASSELVP